MNKVLLLVITLMCSACTGGLNYNIGLLDRHEVKIVSKPDPWGKAGDWVKSWFKEEAPKEDQGS